MKALRLMMIVLVLLMFVSVATAQDATIVGLNDTPTLDGDLSDWPVDIGIFTYDIAIVGAYSTPDNAADLTMTWKGFYNPTDNRLYLGVERTDDIRVDRALNPGIWNTDRLEVYVDGNNDGTGGTVIGIDFQQYVFEPTYTPTATPTATGFDLLPYGNGYIAQAPALPLLGTEYAIAIDGANATYEIALQILDVYPTGSPTPSPVEIALVEGITIGFDITSPDNDDPGDNAAGTFIMWTEVGGKWSSALNYGDVLLGAAEATGTPSPTPTLTPAKDWWLVR